MAARRRSNSRSGGGRPSRAAQSNNNTAVILGVGAVVVVILIAVAVNMSGSTPPAKEDRPKAAAPDPQPAPTPSPKASSPSKKKNSRVLKDPDTPAPELTSDFLSKADAFYTEAKKLHDDARRAQSDVDDGKFNKLINDSWDKMQELDSFIETYTDWLEEADMGDWRVPASYGALQSRMTKWDKLKGGIKRVKPNRR